MDADEVKALTEAVSEQERSDSRLADALDRRDRLLAALALRASSGWSSMSPATRQRVQVVIDAAADRVREMLEGS